MVRKYVPKRTPRTFSAEFCPAARGGTPHPDSALNTEVSA